MVKKTSSFSFQKAFVTERADLIESNRKKWETAMLQRRDKEVVAGLKWSMLLLYCETCRNAERINIGRCYCWICYSKQVEYMESRRKRVEDYENQLQTLRVQDAEEYNMVKIKLETDVQVGLLWLWKGLFFPFVYWLLCNDFVLRILMKN